MTGNAFQLNGCCCDIEPTLLMILGKDLDLIWRSGAVRDQASKIGMDKVAEIHGNEFFSCIASDNFGGTIDIAQKLSLENENCQRHCLEDSAEGSHALSEVSAP